MAVTDETGSDGSPIGGLRFVSGPAVVANEVADEKAIGETSRGAAPATAGLIDALHARDDFDLGPAVQVTTEPTRGGPPTRIAREADEHRGDDEVEVLLVVEDGLARWVLPNGDGMYDVEWARPLPVDRGVLSKVAGTFVRWVVMQVPTKDVANRAFREIEERRRPTRVFVASPDSFEGGSRPATIDSLDWTKGRGLLLLHGLNSSTAGGFRNLSSTMQRLWDAYDGRVIAFDHPTFAVGPGENADVLRSELAGLVGRSGRPLELDVLSHSSGGLVARSLVEDRPPPNVNVRKLIMTGVPNGGTPIATDRHVLRLIELMTAPLSLLPDNPVTSGIELALEALKIIAAKAYEALPGLNALAPDSAYLGELNAGTPANGVTYCAISSDYEPRGEVGVQRRLWDGLTDVVFGESNDLWVPSRSPYARVGRFEVAPSHRLRLDASYGTTHTAYWDNHQVRRQVESWLTDSERIVLGADVAEVATTRSRSGIAEEVERAFEAGDMETVLAELSRDPDQERGAAGDLFGKPIRVPKPPKRPEGTAIIVPGVMGSHLSAGGDRVWIHAWRLIKGHIDKLEMPDDGAGKAMGLHKTYIELAVRLASRRRVSFFPYDWRQPIPDLGKALGDHIIGLRDEGSPRPFTIVAHSMGGLVTRAMMLDNADLWADANGDDNGTLGLRALLLAPPNRGSHAMALAVVGEEGMIKKIASLDLDHDKADLGAIVRSFTGVMQLIPRVGDPEIDPVLIMSDKQTWQGMLDPDEMSGRFEENLRQAARLHDDLEAQESTELMKKSGRVVMVLGEGHDTPYRARVESGGRLKFGLTTAGDGRVALDLGVIDGVPTLFSDADHGGIVSDKSVLDALEPLMTGRFDPARPPEGLRGKRSSARGGAAVSLDRRFWPAGDVPTESDLTRSAMGGAALDEWVPEDDNAWIGGGSRRPQRPALRVRVFNASLEQCESPVIVGHYRGMPIDGAEGFLDSKIGELLTTRHKLDEYPGEAGTAAFVPAPGQQPAGAVVLGLGHFGDLTSTALEQAARSGIKQMMAAQAARHERASLTVASVLVGSPGRFGVTIQESIVAITTGVAKALADLRNAEVELEAFHELKFVELYHSKAEEAAWTVGSLLTALPQAVLEQIAVLPEQNVVVGEGAQTEQGRQSHGSGGWPRFEIKFAPSSSDGHAKTLVGPAIGSKFRTILFKSAGRRARTIQEEVDIDLFKLEGHLSSPRRDDAWQRAVYESIVPQGLKTELSSVDNLHLVLDESVAHIPWEMVAAADAEGTASQLALRAGLLRQFDSVEPKSRPMRDAKQAVALVIGNPKTDSLPDLPAAEEEATIVAHLLRMSGYEVHSFIGSRMAWQDIDIALKTTPASVVHIASHGEFDPSAPDRTGIVLSDGQMIHASDFAQLPTRPDLVFLNACHLGRLESKPHVAQPHRHAASLARQLMLVDVQAVIAAGWAVADRAAMLFAETFYSRMLAGEILGDAVRAARREAHQAERGRGVTWAAYQCYGAPDFSIPSPSGGSGRRGDEQEEYVSARSIRIQAERIRGWVEEAGSTDTDYEDERDAIDRLVTYYERVWQHQDDRPASTAESIADVYSAVADFGQAIKWYQLAVDDANATASLRAVEQLAGIRSRQATQLLSEHRSTSATGAKRNKEAIAAQVDKLIEDSTRHLDALQIISMTAERLAMRGSTYRRLAFVKRLRSPDDSDADLADLGEAELAYEQAAKTSRKTYEASGDSGARAHIWYAQANWAQTWVLRSRLWIERSSLDTDHKRFKQLLSEQAAEIESVERADPDSFWARQAMADVLLTRLLLDARPGNKPITAAAVADAYAGSWRVRSSAGGRRSATDHIQLVMGLLGKGVGPQESMAELAEILAAVR